MLTTAAWASCPRPMIPKIICQPNRRNITKKGPAVITSSPLLPYPPSLELKSDKSQDDLMP